MTLWQVMAFFIVAGGAAYTYVVQPMSLELGVPRLTCWWDGGVYLRATKQERGYRAMMQQSDENRARVQRGEAKGCFNEGRCVLTRAEALGALEQQMIYWTAVGGGELLKGNVLGMLGMRSEEAARAKQAEAQYCINYLAEQRKPLTEGAPEPTP